MSDFSISDKGCISYRPIRYSMSRIEGYIRGSSVFFIGSAQVPEARKDESDSDTLSGVFDEMWKLAAIGELAAVLGETITVDISARGWDTVDIELELEVSLEEICQKCSKEYCIKMLLDSSPQRRETAQRILQCLSEQEEEE